MRKKMRSSAGFSVIEILLIVALIGIIFTILIPNLMDGLNKAIQKRTVADIHSIATGMMAFYTDMHGAAAAGSPVDIGAYDPINHAEVTDLLVPLYMDHLPKNDPWGNPFDYYFGRVTEEYSYELAFGIRSRGKYGVADAQAYAWGAFDPTHYDWDIVWLDGVFVTWPARPQEEATGGGCNQGVGNGPEGCDPGNSNNTQPSNDEPNSPTPGPGDPGRGGKK
jgi:general secretion pathway protein G